MSDSKSRVTSREAPSAPLQFCLKQELQSLAKARSCSLAHVTSALVEKKIVWKTMEKWLMPDLAASPASSLAVNC